MRQKAGITLIELAVVMAIVGILAAMILPSYTHYIQRARRSDGQAALLDLASRMERYYTLKNTYAGATIGVGDATDVLSSAKSPEGWYSLTLNANATEYTLFAAPLNAQTADELCGTLRYTSQGVKGQTGVGLVSQCW